MKTLLIGASKNKERYAYRAMKRLEKAKHELVLFNPNLTDIEGREVIQNLSDIAPSSIDTITLYLSPKNLEPLIEDIIALKPRRIISNPGTESLVMKTAAQEIGINYIEACTLVLLSTNQY